MTYGQRRRHPGSASKAARCAGSGGGGRGDGSPGLGLEGLLQPDLEHGEHGRRQRHHPGPEEHAGPLREDQRDAAQLQQPVERAPAADERALPAPHAHAGGDEARPGQHLPQDQDTEREAGQAASGGLQPHPRGFSAGGR